jgi:hypothetical protein
MRRVLIDYSQQRNPPNETGQEFRLPLKMRWQPPRNAGL